MFVYNLHLMMIGAMRYWHRITFAQSSHWMTVTRAAMRCRRPVVHAALLHTHSSDALPAISTSNDWRAPKFWPDWLAAEVKVSKVEIFTFPGAASAICKMKWTQLSLFQMPRPRLTAATEPINYNFFSFFKRNRFSFPDTSQAAIKHRIIILLCNFVW